MKVLVKLLISLILLGLTLSASNESPTKEEISKLYVATFNRAPDSAGLEWWATSSGLTLEQIAQSFFDQKETQTLYPEGTTNRDFIEAVYQNLFNREPDSAGWDYWEEQLNTGAFSRNSFILAVINGALDTDVSQDATILENKNSVGLAFADAGIDDVEKAKVVMEGITADEKSVDFALSKIESNDIPEDIWSDYYTQLLAGKTFYDIETDIDGNREVAKVIFNQDATSFQIVKSYTTEEWGADIDGNKFICSCDTNGGYSIISENEKYIYLDYRNADGTDSDKDTRLYYTQTDAQAYIDSTSFTQEMLTDKSYYDVYKYDNDPEAYGIVIRYFNDNVMTLYDSYDYKLFDSDFTLKDGKIIRSIGDYTIEYRLLSQESDYLDVQGTVYDPSNQAIDYFNSRLYYDEAKAAEYEKSLETYDNSFFNSIVTFTKPEVIEHVDFAKLDISHMSDKIRFYDYGFSQNSYNIDTTGVTLKAEPVSGEKSLIKGYLIAKPYNYRGVAVDIETKDLDDERNNRVKIFMNAYNDGTQDVSATVSIFKDKIVYYQWQSETADDEQTLQYYTTILSNNDFRNKNIRVAIWVQNAKVHFYVECEGDIGYKTFDISGYENNPLENSHWSGFNVEAKDGATIATEAKFTKIYTIRPNNNLGDDTYLKSLVIGNSFYNYCSYDDSLYTLVFNEDGTVTGYDNNELDSSFTYTINGNSLVIADDEETHVLAIAGDDYIVFDGNNDMDRFYLSESDAKANPAENCEDDEDDYQNENTLITDLVSGNVTFKDENNETISVPSDAWVRLVPTQYQEDNSWHSLRCRVESDGSFGSECYTNSDEGEIRTIFNDSSSLYQIVVFKNDIEPDNNNWECGEDLYKYIGNDLDSSAWQNIIVYPDDYQDRSDEECSE